MNEKKIQTDSYDILKRRLRYETVFVLLIAAFCVITVLNINIGSVPISVREIARSSRRR